MAQESTAAGGAGAGRVRRLLVVATAVVTAAAALAWWVRGGVAGEVVEVPGPGEADFQRLSDGTPVVVTRQSEELGGEVTVLDARAPRLGDGAVRGLVGRCGEQPRLVDPLPRRVWDLTGRPIVLDPHMVGDEARSNMHAHPPLARYELDGPVRGDAVAVGARAVPGPDEAPPRQQDPRQEGGCHLAHLAGHDPLGRRRTVGDLTDAGDGRYAVEALVEYYRESLAMCARPDELEPSGQQAAPSIDGRGVLPACGGDLDLGGPLELDGPGISLPPPGEHEAVGWVGTLEVVVADGAVVDVAVPPGATSVWAATGGEVVVAGCLDAEVEPSGDAWLLVPLSEIVDRAHGRPGPTPPGDVALDQPQLVEPDGPPGPSGDLPPLDLWLAVDAELALPGGERVEPEAFLAAWRDGDLDGAAYEAVIDRVTGETVALTPTSRPVRDAARALVCGDDGG